MKIRLIHKPLRRAVFWYNLKVAQCYEGGDLKNIETMTFVGKDVPDEIAVRYLKGEIGPEDLTDYRP